MTSSLLLPFWSAKQSNSASPRIQIVCFDSTSRALLKTTCLNRRQLPVCSTLLCAHRARTTEKAGGVSLIRASGLPRRATDATGDLVPDDRGGAAVGKLLCDNCMVFMMDCNEAPSASAGTAR